MSTRFTGEQLALQSTMREFAEKEIAPRSKEILTTEDDFIPRDLFKRMAELGIPAVMVKKEYGGLGLGLTEACIIHEEISKVSPSMGLVAMCVMSQAETLQDWEPARKKYLPGILSGDIVCDGAATAPEGHTNMADWQVIGTRDGDDWIINGTKLFCSMNTAADLQMLYGFDEDREFRIWFIEGDTPGFEHRAADNKLGMHGSGGGTSSFTNVRVPGDMCAPGGIGNSNQYYHLYSIASVIALGAAEGAYEIAEKWAHTRTSNFKPLTNYQSIRHKLAHCATELAILRAAIYESTELTDDPENADRGHMLAQMCKAFVPDECLKIVHDLNILMAGYGYHNVEWYHFYCDIMGCIIMDLPTDYQYEELTVLLGLTEGLDQ